MSSQARKALGAYRNEKSLYREFVRTGIKNGYKDNTVTVLLKDIKDETGRIVTDHQWFNMTKGFEQTNLKLGDIVEFRATMKKYIKGYKGRQEYIFYKPKKADHMLSRPNNIIKLDK